MNESIDFRAGQIIPVGAGCSPMPAIQAQESCQKQAPRKGAWEFAEDAATRIAGRSLETLQQEIIRAREIGQREGREDAQVAYRQQVAELETTVAHYSRELALQRKMPVLYYEIQDPRVTELQTQLQALRYELDRTVKQAQASAEKATQLRKMNENQYQTIEGMQKTNAEQAEEIRVLKEANRMAYRIRYSSRQTGEA